MSATSSLRSSPSSSPALTASCHSPCTLATQHDAQMSPQLSSLATSVAPSPVITSTPLPTWPSSPSAPSIFSLLSPSSSGADSLLSLTSAAQPSPDVSARYTVPSQAAIANLTPSPSVDNTPAVRRYMQLMHIPTSPVAAAVLAQQQHEQQHQQDNGISSTSSPPLLRTRSSLTSFSSLPSSPTHADSTTFLTDTSSTTSPPAASSDATQVVAAVATLRPAGDKDDATQPSSPVSLPHPPPRLPSLLPTSPLPIRRQSHLLTLAHDLKREELENDRKQRELKRQKQEKERERERELLKVKSKSITSDSDALSAAAELPLPPTTSAAHDGAHNNSSGHQLHARDKQTDIQSGLLTDTFNRINATLLTPVPHTSSSTVSHTHPSPSSLDAPTAAAAAAVIHSQIQLPIATMPSSFLGVHAAVATQKPVIKKHFKQQKIRTKSPLNQGASHTTTTAAHHESSEHASNNTPSKLQNKRSKKRIIAKSESSQSLHDGVSASIAENTQLIRSFSALLPLHVPKSSVDKTLYPLSHHRTNKSPSRTQVDFDNKHDPLDSSLMKSMSLKSLPPLDPNFSFTQQGEGARELKKALNHLPMPLKDIKPDMFAYEYEPEMLPLNETPVRGESSGQRVARVLNSMKRQHADMEQKVARLEEFKQQRAVELKHKHEVQAKQMWDQLTSPTSAKSNSFDQMPDLDASFLTESPHNEHPSNENNDAASASNSPTHALKLTVPTSNDQQLVSINADSQAMVSQEQEQEQEEDTIPATPTGFYFAHLYRQRFMPEEDISESDDDEFEDVGQLSSKTRELLRQVFARSRQNAGWGGLTRAQIAMLASTMVESGQKREKRPKYKKVARNRDCYAKGNGFISKKEEAYKLSDEFVSVYGSMNVSSSTYELDQKQEEMELQRIQQQSQQLAAYPNMPLTYDRLQPAWLEARSDFRHMKPNLKTMSCLNALSKPISQRTPLESIKINEFLLSLPYFKNFHASPRIQSELTNLCKLTEFKRGTVLYKQNDLITSFYILISGSVVLSSNDNIAPNGGVKKITGLSLKDIVKATLIIKEEEEMKKAAANDTQDVSSTSDELADNYNTRDQDESTENERHVQFRPPPISTDTAPLHFVMPGELFGQCQSRTGSNIHLLLDRATLWSSVIQLVLPRAQSFTVSSRLRTETAETYTDCIVLSMPQADHDAILRSNKDHHIRKVISKLRRVSMLRKWRTKHLNRVAENVQTRCYSAGSIIAREGDLHHHLYVIVKGNVSLMKGVEIVTFSRLPTQHQKWEIQQHQTWRRFQTGKKSVGDLVCDECLLGCSKLDFTYRCDDDVTCYVIPRSQFFHFFRAPTVAHLRASVSALRSSAVNMIHEKFAHSNQFMRAKNERPSHHRTIVNMLEGHIDDLLHPETNAANNTFQPPNPFMPSSPVHMRDILTPSGAWKQTQTVKLTPLSHALANHQQTVIARDVSNNSHSHSHKGANNAPHSPSKQSSFTHSFSNSRPHSPHKSPSIPPPHHIAPTSPHLPITTLHGSVSSDALQLEESQVQNRVDWNKEINCNVNHMQVSNNHVKSRDEAHIDESPQINVYFSMFTL